MKSLIFINIISIILGVAALFYKEMTDPNREKITDIGPIQAVRETKKTFLLSPILVGIAQAGRTVLTLIGRDL
jgi:hypothetical protein